jgi:hypothetical protein
LLSFAPSDVESQGAIRPWEWKVINAFLTPEGCASFSPPISSADFDLGTLDMELGRG